ncbi:conserved hypothetical protein [Theileria orientalis strain Shintoku]|uniref:Uncharacterized protein n=1 Tax=Theileria orientalis strain Shintoku TaxID=869250 RepID=J4DPP1_THEOR|nr:conserved hypothetical protein [Theileria orientalis strain Shintoku]BAM41044.1 conserved hypothetical protein [Theileria orientalis strain Shintoku]|eukprot:XP_009691345.1 conserved hypothetical protein [Theileria orientalis strain Shintoku]
MFIVLFYILWFFSLFTIYITTITYTLMARFLKKLLSNKTDEQEESFTSAHLGEENNFYYNEELKQWVVRGEEDKVRESTDNAPPPPGPLGPNLDPSVPPNAQFAAAAHDGQSPESPAASNPFGRRVVRSSQLYTNIPGMNVIEAKVPNESFVNIPTSGLSQFIPKKDDFDASLVNDAYADLMRPSSPPVEATEETPEQNGHLVEDQAEQVQ